MEIISTAALHLLSAAAVNPAAEASRAQRPRPARSDPRPGRPARRLGALSRSPPRCPAPRRPALPAARLQGSLRVSPTSPAPAPARSTPEPSTPPPPADPPPPFGGLPARCGWTHGMRWAHPQPRGLTHQMAVRVARPVRTRSPTSSSASASGRSRVRAVQAVEESAVRRSATTRAPGVLELDDGVAEAYSEPAVAVQSTPAADSATVRTCVSSVGAGRKLSIGCRADSSENRR